MSEIAYAYLVVALGATSIVSAFYVLSKLLDWSKKRRLPGTENRLVHTAALALVAATALLLLLDIELLALYNELQPQLIAFVEYVDVIAAIVLVILVGGILRVIRRRKMR